MGNIKETIEQSIKKAKNKQKLEDLRNLVYKQEDELSEIHERIIDAKSRREEEYLSNKAIKLYKSIVDAKNRYYPEMLLAGVKLRRVDVDFILKSGAMEKKLRQPARTKQQIESALKTLEDYAKGRDREAQSESLPQTKGTAIFNAIKSAGGKFTKKPKNNILGDFEYTTPQEDIDKAVKRQETIKKLNRFIAGGFATLMLSTSFLAGYSVYDKHFKNERSEVTAETVESANAGDQASESVEIPSGLTGSENILGSEVSDDGTLFYNYSNYVAKVSLDPTIQQNYEKMLKDTRENPTYEGSSGGEFVYLDSNTIASVNATNFVRELFNNSSKEKYREIGQVLTNEFSTTAKSATNYVETSTEVGTGINYAGCYGLFQMGADAVVDANLLAHDLTGKWLLQTELARYSESNKNTNGGYLNSMSQLNDEDLKRLDSPEFGAVVSLFVDACNINYLKSCNIQCNKDNIVGTYLEGIGNMQMFYNYGKLDEVENLKYCRLQTEIDKVLQERLRALLSENGLNEYKNSTYTKSFVNRISAITSNSEYGLDAAQKEKEDIASGVYFEQNDKQQ